MRFDDLVQLLGGQPYFDLATIVQLSGAGRPLLRTQLHRWASSGKLIALRRGMYMLADHYRRRPVNQAVLANAIHVPSYLSGLWALGLLGLIPERVVTYTSVTTRAPRRFENATGVFEYRHVKQEFFFGYKVVEIQQEKVLLAEPEKALLDLWHLHAGVWTRERMRAMRFQNQDTVDPKRLATYARRWSSPRLLAAVAVWNEDAASEREGTVDV